MPTTAELEARLKVLETNPPQPPTHAWASSLGDKVSVSVSTAVAMALLTFVWNWASNGGIVRALGGVTKDELLSNAALRGPQGERGPPGPQAAPSQQGQADRFPKGMVVASTEPCDMQLGWHDYLDAMGRVLVGAVPPKYSAARQNLDENSRPLSSRQQGDSGGSEGFVLSADNVPSQEVTLWTKQTQVHIGYIKSSSNADNGNYTTMYGSDKASNVELKTTGKGTEHKYMPPFIAVHFCSLQ
jgi:hypothetical protein